MADIYVAISQCMQKELTELGVHPSKIRYIPNAVDTNVFQPDGNREENLILFVGRITFGKGLHVLLKALHYLKTKVHLVIIGPSDWDIQYFQEIENEIDQENRNGVHTITYLGEQGQDTIVQWCQKASIFVLPSYREACGLAILEALSCETPVVATDIDGIREVVVNGKDGLLVSTSNFMELASSIQYLLDNELVRTSFGREGRKRVLKDFSYDEAITRLSQIYKELT